MGEEKETFITFVGNIAPLTLHWMMVMLIQLGREIIEVLQLVTSVTSPAAATNATKCELFCVHGKWFQKGQKYKQAEVGPLGERTMGTLLYLYYCRHPGR